jgi:hypothetical protein
MPGMSSGSSGATSPATRAALMPMLAMPGPPGLPGEGTTSSRTVRRVDSACRQGCARDSNPSLQLKTVTNALFDIRTSVSLKSCF